MKRATTRQRRTRAEREAEARAANIGRHLHAFAHEAYTSAPTFCAKHYDDPEALGKFRAVLAAMLDDEGRGQ